MEPKSSQNKPIGKLNFPAFLHTDNAVKSKYTPYVKPKINKVKIPDFLLKNDEPNSGKTETKRITFKTLKTNPEGVVNRPKKYIIDAPFTNVGTSNNNDSIQPIENEKSKKNEKEGTSEKQSNTEDANSVVENIQNEYEKARTLSEQAEVSSELASFGSQQLNFHNETVEKNAKSALNNYNNLKNNGKNDESAKKAESIYNNANSAVKNFQNAYNKAQEANIEVQKAAEENKVALQKIEESSKKAKALMDKGELTDEKIKLLNEYNDEVKEQSHKISENIKNASEQAKVVSSQAKYAIEQSKVAADQSNFLDTLSTNASEKSRNILAQAQAACEKAEQAKQQSKLAQDIYNLLKDKQELIDREVNNAVLQANAVEKLNGNVPEEAKKSLEAIKEIQEKGKKALMEAQEAKCKAETCSQKAQLAKDQIMSVSASKNLSDKQIKFVEDQCRIVDTETKEASNYSKLASEKLDTAKEQSKILNDNIDIIAKKTENALSEPEPNIENVKNIVNVLKDAEIIKENTLKAVNVAAEQADLAAQQFQISKEKFDMMYKKAEKLLQTNPDAASKIMEIVEKAKDCINQAKDASKKAMKEKEKAQEAAKNVKSASSEIKMIFEVDDMNEKSANNIFYQIENINDETENAMSYTSDITKNVQIADDQTMMATKYIDEAEKLIAESNITNNEINSPNYIEKSVAESNKKAEEVISKAEAVAKKTKLTDEYAKNSRDYAKSANDQISVVQRTDKNVYRETRELGLMTEAASAKSTEALIKANEAFEKANIASEKVKAASKQIQLISDKSDEIPDCSELIAIQNKILNEQARIAKEQELVSELQNKIAAESVEQTKENLEHISKIVELVKSEASNDAIVQLVADYDQTISENCKIAAKQTEASTKTVDYISEKAKETELNANNAQLYTRTVCSLDEDVHKKALLASKEASQAHKNSQKAVELANDAKNNINMASEQIKVAADGIESLSRLEKLTIEQATFAATQASLISQQTKFLKDQSKILEEQSKIVEQEAEKATECGNIVKELSKSVVNKKDNEIYDVVEVLACAEESYKTVIDAKEKLEDANNKFILLSDDIKLCESRTKSIYSQSEEIEKIDKKKAQEVKKYADNAKNNQVEGAKCARKANEARDKSELAAKKAQGAYKKIELILIKPDITKTEQEYVAEQKKIIEEFSRVAAEEAKIAIDQSNFAKKHIVQSKELIDMATSEIHNTISEANADCDHSQIVMEYIENTRMNYNFAYNHCKLANEQYDLAYENAEACENLMKTLNAKMKDPLAFKNVYGNSAYLTQYEASFAYEKAKYLYNKAQDAKGKAEIARAKTKSALKQIELLTSYEKIDSDKSKLATELALSASEQTDVAIEQGRVCLEYGWIGALQVQKIKDCIKYIQTMLIAENDIKVTNHLVDLSLENALLISGKYENAFEQYRKAVDFVELAYAYFVSVEKIKFENYSETKLVLEEVKLGIKETKESCSKIKQARSNTRLFCDSNRELYTKFKVTAYEADLIFENNKLITEQTEIANKNAEFVVAKAAFIIEKANYIINQIKAVSDREIVDVDKTNFDEYFGDSVIIDKENEFREINSNREHIKDIKELSVVEISEEVKELQKNNESIIIHENLSSADSFVNIENDHLENVSINHEESMDSRISENHDLSSRKESSFREEILEMDSIDESDVKYEESDREDYSERSMDNKNKKVKQDKNLTADFDPFYSKKKNRKLSKSKRDDDVDNSYDVLESVVHTYKELNDKKAYKSAKKENITHSLEYHLKVRNDNCGEYTKISKTFCNQSNYNEYLTSKIKSKSKLETELKQLKKLKIKFGYSIAINQENFYKNKFSDSVPYNYNRIIIDPTISKNREETYYNASYIYDSVGNVDFLCCQYPSKEQEGETFYDIVAANKIKLVVMLNNFEFLSDGKKELFAPNDKVSKVNYEKFSVHLINKEEKHDIHIYKMRIKHKDSNFKYNFTLMHYYKIDLFDKKFPANALHNMVNNISEQRNETPETPVLVSCRDGSNFSGLLIAMYYIKKDLVLNESFDITKTCLFLKYMRKNVISEVEHYKWLHMFTHTYCKKLAP